MKDREMQLLVAFQGNEAQAITLLKLLFITLLGHACLSTQAAKSVFKELKFSIFPVLSATGRSRICATDTAKS